MCFILGADFYQAVAAGDVEMVTDHIDHMDATGIVLKSGRRLDADVIITATGIQLQALGGVTVSIDGEKINPHERFAFRRHLLEDVPNAAWCFGYSNASWTLGADMTARSVAKLLAYMDSHGYTHAYPHLGDAHMPEQPVFNLQSGYVLRAQNVLPKSGVRRPWAVTHNYLRDAIGKRFESIEESMVFGRATTASAPQAQSEAASVRLALLSVRRARGARRPRRRWWLVERATRRQSIATHRGGIRHRESCAQRRGMSTARVCRRRRIDPGRQRLSASSTPDMAHEYPLVMFGSARRDVLQVAGHQPAAEAASVGQPWRNEQARAFGGVAVGCRHRQRSVDADRKAPHRSRMRLQIQARAGIKRLARPQPDRRAAGLWKRRRRPCPHADLLVNRTGGYRDDRGHRRNRRVLRWGWAATHSRLRRRSSARSASPSGKRRHVLRSGRFTADSGSRSRACWRTRRSPATMSGKEFWSPSPPRSPGWRSAGSCPRSSIRRTAFYPNWFYCLVEAVAAAALFVVSVR